MPTPSAAAVGGSERAVDLTQSEVLVLMCIAYFQPITRGELSSFFGKEISRDLIGHLRGARLDRVRPAQPDSRARPTPMSRPKSSCSSSGSTRCATCRISRRSRTPGCSSKEKLLAGDIMPGFAGNEERDGLLETDK